MKILHTADWHLAKRLDLFSRHKEQIEILEEIIITKQQGVDLVIITGNHY